MQQDLDKGIHLYEKACNGGFAEGCKNLGNSYWNGMGVQKDLAKVVQLFEKACGGGYAMGCYSLGGMYHAGTDVQKDEGKSAEYYQKACDSGESYSCYIVGGYYHDGTGVQKNDAKAAQFYQKACDDGVPGGCTNIGYRPITKDDGLSCAFSQDLTLTVGGNGIGTMESTADHFGCIDRAGMKRSIQLTSVGHGAWVAIRTKDFGTVFRGNEAGNAYEMTDDQIKKLKAFLGF